jgi:two-component system response regulator MprA
MHVLIVEDNKKMAGLLRKGLEERSHSVTLAFDGCAGFEAAASSDFAAVILDLMLPKMDGFELLRRLRKSDDQTPILILSARDATADIVRALDLGADDYLTKPFSFAELLARLRVLSQFGSVPRPTVLRVADIVLDPSTCQVTRAGQEIRLSRTEFRLLECLMRRRGQIVPRDIIVENVWDHEQDIEENTLDALVFTLRSKIDKNFDSKLIQTIRGIGHSIREAKP